MLNAGPDQLIDAPCVVFALRQESRPFCRKTHSYQAFPASPCWACFCGSSNLPVLVVETGVGQNRTERVLRWLLSEPQLGGVPYKPKLVLAAGFCGALQDDLRCGDLILATEVIDADSGDRWRALSLGELPIRSGDCPLRKGRLVTVSALAATSQQKQQLGKTWAALAVDMESAAAARLCQQHDVPFGCLRVVLDEADTSLSPRLVSLLSSAQVSLWHVATAVASAPGLALDLWQLAKQSRLAGRELGKALWEALKISKEAEKEQRTK